MDDTLKPSDGISPHSNNAYSLKGDPASRSPQKLGPPSRAKGHTMLPSSAFCREREAHHHGLASLTKLDNVRLKESTAADAWAREGDAALLREDRAMRTRAFAEKSALANALPTAEESTLSENPDRGRSDP